MLKKAKKKRIARGYTRIDADLRMKRIKKSAFSLIRVNLRASAGQFFLIAGSA
jgi:hypothetical protein